MWNMANWLITQQNQSSVWLLAYIMHSQNKLPNFNSLQLTRTVSPDSLCPHDLLVVCILQLQPAQQEAFLRTRSTDMVLACMCHVPCPSKIRWGSSSVHHEEYLHVEATVQFTVENPLDMLVTVVHTCNPIASQKEDAMNLKTVSAKSKTLSQKVNWN